MIASEIVALCLGNLGIALALACWLRSEAQHSDIEIERKLYVIRAKHAEQMAMLKIELMSRIDAIEKKSSH